MNTRMPERSYGNGFRVGMGAESIKELLKAIDLKKILLN